MEKKKKPTESKGTRLDRKVLEPLIFGGGVARRFTQDSPVLPDVWMTYGDNCGAEVDLLLNPYGETTPGKLFNALRERLLEMRKAADPNDKDSTPTATNLAYNQSTVVVTLRFDELIRAVLPMTGFWKDFVSPQTKGKKTDKRRSLRSFRAFLDDERKVVLDLGELGAIEEAPINTSNLSYPAEWLWMVKVIGMLHYAQNNVFDAEAELPADIVCFKSFANLLRRVPALKPEHEKLVFSIARNRPAIPATWRSTLAVKADAARLLFNISCERLNWAILDSGIDAKHPAFRKRTPAGKPQAIPKKGEWTERTRVKATYDFRKMRDILSVINDLPDDVNAGKEALAALKELFPAKGMDELNIAKAVKSIQASLRGGYYLDWDVLEPILRVPHDQSYSPPIHEHGTHVAGILAGNWTSEENGTDHNLLGVCPDINLYDLRVLGDDGSGDEFSILGALQFIRYLNSHKEYISVHGANLSLSIRHSVENFACGCTPVCEESNRLVNSGTVVVAAAGNEGYLQYATPNGGSTEGYRSISITDPGNADLVITVGSTHALEPHNYGVSYFSSRGPTGDGRIKPDLVAPGEKISSSIPGDLLTRKDGTSMAAPHVSGAAAMLMARHSELLGHPQKVKEILCRTATDLGRERYFQGSGMLDILRAIQSV